jgi:hypothetical protein
MTSQSKRSHPEEGVNETTSDHLVASAIFSRNLHEVKEETGNTGVLNSLRFSQTDHPTPTLT